MEAKKANQVWLLRAAYDRLSRAKEEGGKSFEEIGVKRSTFHLWKTKLVTEAADRCAVVAGVLALFCLRVGIPPRELPWASEADRLEVERALQEVPEDPGGGAAAGWKVDGEHRLPRPRGPLFGPAADLV